MSIALTLNGRPFTFDGDPETPLLWVIREAAGLTGTKYGCGVAACGACTVHLDGAAVRSCAVPVGSVAGAAVTTIEGLAGTVEPSPADGLHPVQRAWIEIQVPQCGYCQPGMIMAAAALLRASPSPSGAEIDAAITNLCRCGTYPRVRRAIRALAAQA